MKYKKKKTWNQETWVRWEGLTITCDYSLQKEREGIKEVLLEEKMPDKFTELMEVEESYRSKISPQTLYKIERNYETKHNYDG